MLIYLPSHGFFGQSSCSLRIPSFGDLHQINSYNKDELLRKYHFVKMLSDIDFHKVTNYDIDYLFMVLGLSLMYNVIEYSLPCESCGQTLKTSINLSGRSVLDLKLRPSQLPFHKRINGKKYSYNLLSAFDYLQCYQEAQYKDDIDFSFESLLVSHIMSLPLDKVQALPVSLYSGALLFQKLNYHGIDTLESLECPQCHHITSFHFTLDSSILSFDSDAMFLRYVSVSDRLSLSDFMSMSIVDFNSFIDSLNILLSHE